MTAEHSIRIGEWTFDPASGEIESETARVRLAPKASALLALLASGPGRVVTRDEICAALWPDVVVADDSLARLVSSLRKALGDDPRAPRFIETLPKRGYRLVIDPSPAAAPAAQLKRAPAAVLAGVAAVLVAAIVGVSLTRTEAPAPERDRLIARADDFYFQYTPEDNEAAIALYERIIAARPEDPNALSGLANALVQRAMRWPLESADMRGEITTLGQALASGRLDEPAAKRQVARALLLASDAVRLAPRSAPAHKALGLAQSADGRFDLALASYETAISLDPSSWGVLINIADVLEIIGRTEEAMPYFERAYTAMEDAYPSQSARVRPWQARLGVAIAERRLVSGDRAGAERQLRDVLVFAPLDRDATRLLAALLAQSGSKEEAARLCRNFAERAGEALC